MTVPMPMFPLNTVMFPGISVPLHVFEDRYRALVHRMIAIENPRDRLFGVVAIREGYEVGEHGSRSLHRVGTVMQLTAVDALPDGRFDIEAVGRQRLRLSAMETDQAYLVGSVDLMTEADEAGEIGAELRETADRARVTFGAYRDALSALRGTEVLDGELPSDPLYLSYALSATCLLTLQERQSLLEADDALTRLVMLQGAMREEMRSMRAVPSLPATEVARTRWSPN